MTTYLPEVLEQASQILWAEAELLDRCAGFITSTHMTADEASAYLADLAAMYRRAASDATRGRDEITA